MKPALSVLMPVYQPKLEYLHSAISSILKQSYSEFTLLLIEARSQVVIDDLVRQFEDPRICHLRYPGSPSLVDQLNYGLQEAQTALVARMDADDWSFPERFQMQIDYLQRHPGIALVGTQIGIMDSRDYPLGCRHYPTSPDHIRKCLRQFNPVAHPSVMYHRDAILQAGGYWYRRYPANEDYELWCRLDKQGYRMANLEETLLRYRIHPGAMKSAHLKKILRGTRLVKRHYFADRMAWSDRGRYWAEGALLNLPSWMILKLFQSMQYQQE